MRKIIVSPSILSADFANLKREIKKVEKAGADWLHIDIMDGHFVPNITIGPVVIGSLRKYTDIFFDVHLMVSDPIKYWHSFKDAGANLITFHYELDIDKKKLIRDIKSSGIQVGISIKPDTPVADIIDFIPFLDLVLVMSVEPGFGGQSFIKTSLSKIEQIRTYIDKNKYQCLIEVDGGINKETAKQCLLAGANVLVSGSYIFSSTNPKKIISILKNTNPEH
jgi:ribulose-phosphate 3-epimerase